MANRIAREVGEAFLTSEFPTRQTTPAHSTALVDAAKRVQRLQTKAAKLRRDLKRVLDDIKVEKRHLRALIKEIAGPS